MLNTGYLKDRVTQVYLNCNFIHKIGFWDILHILITHNKTNHWKNQSSVISLSLQMLFQGVKIKVMLKSSRTAKGDSCSSHHMEMGDPPKALHWLGLNLNILFRVGVFSMHSGCRCLKVIEFDLDFIVNRSNLLIYLLGFLCVSAKYEGPTSVGILSSRKDLIQC